MALFHNYNFPVDDLDPSNTIQVKVKMYSTAVGSDVNDNTPRSSGLEVNRYGSLVWEYDLEDRFVMPGRMDLEFVDTTGTLADYFFSRSASFDDFEVRNSEVELLLNSVLEFSGKIIEDSVQYDEGDKLLSFTVASHSEVINDKVLILDDDTIVNPFNFTNPGGIIPVGANDPNIYQHIWNIYALIEPFIGLEWQHGWRAKTDNSDPNYNIELRYIHWNPYEAYFWDQQILKTAGDQLRKLAFNFNAYTGLLHQTQAFFKQLHWYDSSNVFTPNVLDLRRIIEYPSYEFVRINNNDGASLVQAERGDEEEAGAVGKYVKSNAFLFNFNFFSYQSTMWHLNTSDRLTGIQDTSISSTQQYHIDILADCVWHHRGFHRRNNRTTEFKMNGVTNYAINKDFTYNSIQHNCLKIEKDFDEVITNIKALEIR